MSNYFFKEYKSILSQNNGMNIYRGCTHGCIYCDSRSNVYNIDHEFDLIEVKKDAPKMLDFELSKKRKPVMVGTGSMSDPYNHIEKEIEYTRKCLEVIYKHSCGLTILTKSDLILRDFDLICKINERAKAVVEMTLTTADEELCKIVEPNVATTKERVEVLKKFSDAGVKTLVWLCPFLPYINDAKENIMKLMEYLSYAKVYGIVFFGSGLTLRDGNREYFYQKLDEHFPSLKEKYIKQYGNRYEISSNNSKEIYEIVRSECKKRGIIFNNKEIFSFMNELEEKNKQLSLFDDIF